MSTTSELPAQLGYRFPAEWEPHRATWLAWPHNPETWPGKRETILSTYVRFVKLLAEVETVHLLAGGPQVRDEAEHYLGNSERVVLHDIPTNDAWVRDHGPTFLSGPRSLPPALVDWQFNSWGEKYPPYDLDNDVPRQVAQWTGRRRFAAPWVVEGGGIEGNGQGTILTTRHCLLSPRRNRGASETDLEGALRDYLGARHVVWLDGELEGDDTDGHVDQVARFVGPRTVVACREENSADENFAPLEDNWRRLAQAHDADGRPLELVALPMPAPLYYQGQRLPASYANYCLANQLIIVPQFGDSRRDPQALEILQSAFPDRTAVGLSAVDIVWGLGAFHCLSQQEPQPYL
jgi:agmatine deiminase